MKRFESQQEQMNETEPRRSCEKRRQETSLRKDIVLNENIAEYQNRRHVLTLRSRNL